MLSALIKTEHSYPAMPLARQLVHQRFVPPGPLVTLSLITKGADYIFIPGFARESAYYPSHLVMSLTFDLKDLRISRYGVKPKTINNSLPLFFLFVT